MQFKSEDFKGMQFNPEVIPADETVFTYYKIFNKYAPFVKDVYPLSKDRVMIYIICMYSINSPFLTIDNVMNRKLAAAEYARFQDSQGLISKEYQQVIYGHNKEVMAMAIQFLRMMHSISFTELMVYEDAIYMAFLELTDKEKDSADKTKLLGNIDRMKRSIRDLNLSMFYGVDEKLEQGLLEVLEQERMLELSPESFARRKKVGRPKRILNTIPDKDADVVMDRVQTMEDYLDEVAPLDDSDSDSDPEEDEPQNFVEKFLVRRMEKIKQKDIPDAAKEARGYQA